MNSFKKTKIEKKKCSCNKVLLNKKQEHVANSPTTTSTNPKKKWLAKLAIS
jgi:hypothetical protein